MTIFDYPATPHRRRHGPVHKRMEDYHDWLRDEFEFRCVYCLYREIWGPVRAFFHKDHLVPVCVDPTRKLDYDNLLYTCAGCNLIKNRRTKVPDPCSVAFGKCLRVMPNWEVEALSVQGEVIIDATDLNDPHRVAFRRVQYERWESAVKEGRAEREAGYPLELCDLSKKNPISNSRPEGVLQSCFERRKRGELPRTY